MNYFDKLKKLDLFVLAVMTCLVAIGTFAVYEATRGTRLEGLHSSNMMLFGLFCVPMLLVALFDYRLLTGKLSYVLYAIGIVMLVWVKWKGENINGAVRWLTIGNFQIQPSELVKISTILLAAHLLNKRAGEKLRLVQDIVPILAIFIVPTILIMKQPDLGTALVFVGVLLGMLWKGNIRATYLLIGLSAAALCIGAVIWLYYSDYELLSNLVKSHQISRLQTFLDPASDPDKSWHVKNAMRAIGVGGLSGSSGFFTQNGYIPYVYSDSIFVVIGEEHGFIGAALLLLLYFLLIYQMVRIVGDGKELTGSYVVIGIACMFVFQIFVNVGMHVGLVPLTGISLPFISYGGSSLLLNMLAVGLVLSVKIHQNEPAY
ncbi:FtsW/RodA/SpoVE family cell cycle protein [Paenibacillus ginsengarvi]|uniref:Rod shape-determining protein RodA n=1 Tax=Paenibacillus ginsengarvi TaxID=400777 RepID=A0A3B0CB28_9BACL|nr:FtsW/RodA/SpoVE family cell cycle protein [Paenibacillus ginsengarvi]RKN82011.1 rod shape-determining protein RodA [Paenibacillus ginsengarvi]